MNGILGDTLEFHIQIMVHFHDFSKTVPEMYVYLRIFKITL